MINKIVESEWTYLILFVATSVFLYFALINS